MSALAPVLCVFGTASDVGKSLVVTALCRVLSDRGFRVGPFKAQNMSNNSGVTRDGKEMGRAQFLQAQAARAEPHVDMNPVLLKPSSDRVSQVVLNGEPLAQVDAKAYFQRRAESLRIPAFEALRRLRGCFQVVVVEGAGSCAEVNLRDREFVNFPVAHEADAPVLLVADIDRGGVFAQIVGSLEVMPKADRERVRGVLINRFRGDPELFHDGVRYLEERTSVPVLGVLPFARELALEAEDALNLNAIRDPPAHRDEDALVRVAVVLLPHLSNFTDFDALSQCPSVALHYLSRPVDLDRYHLVVLPGTKTVRADLDWLRRVGWEARLRTRHRSGQAIAGICGGYQMLGQSVSDPLGVEGPAGESRGLGLLAARTRLESNKVLQRVRAWCPSLRAEVWGYEIHMGRTQSDEQPFLGKLVREPPGGELCDGSQSPDGSVWGCYLHGFFDSPALLEALLERLRPGYRDAVGPSPLGYQREAQLEALARHFESHVDVDALLRQCELPVRGD